MKKRWIQIVFICLCLVGIGWFTMPVLHGGFREGSVFGVCVCGFGVVLAVLYPKLAAGGGWRKAIARIAAACYALGLAWAGFLTALILSYQAAAPPAGLNVVVLGAQVYSAERMGRSLSYRVDSAYRYLTDNPEVKCIVTGGQGPDEPCPEALTAKNVLTRMGIDPARIFVEDRSRNTRQNLTFAREIADRQGLGSQAVIVTQSFHLFRAVRLAEDAGFEAYGLAAETDPIIYPQYYGRELLSLTKWFMEELF